MFETISGRIKMIKAGPADFPPAGGLGKNACGFRTGGFRKFDCYKKQKPYADTIDPPSTINTPVYCFIFLFLKRDIRPIIKMKNNPPGIIYIRFFFKMSGSSFLTSAYWAKI